MALESIEDTTIPGDRLPTGHPPPHTGPIEGPSVWYGPDLAVGGSWAYELSPSERQELLTALSEVRRRELDIQKFWT